MLEFKHLGTSGECSTYRNATVALDIAWVALFHLLLAFYAQVQFGSSTEIQGKSPWSPLFPTHKPNVPPMGNSQFYWIHIHISLCLIYERQFSENEGRVAHTNQPKVNGMRQQRVVEVESFMLDVRECLEGPFVLRCGGRGDLEIDARRIEFDRE